MKLQNKSYIFLLLFFFGSCVAKKSTIEYKETIVRDTVSVEVIKTVIKPVKKIIYVDSPCDTLGVLKPFEKEFVNDKVRVKVYNDKGNVKVDIDIDSIKDVSVKEVKVKSVSNKETKEVVIVKYKYPLWLLISLVVSVLLNLLLLKSKLF